MKIVQVVPYFYPAWSYGGPAKLVYDTSSELTRQGHDVTVYTSDAFDATSRMPEDKKISDFHVRYFRNLSNWLAFHVNAYFPTALFLRAPFELKNFDIIHIHDFYTAANIWVTWWARWYHIPYVISVHGCLEVQRRQQKSILKNLFLKFFGASMLSHASMLVATSDNEETAYKTFGIPKKKIARIGHGVNRAEFETIKTSEYCRKQFKIPQNSVVYTFVGRLHPIKGLDLLIEAFAGLNTKNAFLVIAGSDEGFLSTIKKIIRERKITKRVLLLGPTTGETKARLFKASDVFVYPSRSEGFSLGILEAASIGLPLLITTACHFDEVGRRRAGIVVDVAVSSIRGGLSQMNAYSGKERVAIGVRAAALIAQKYSTEAIGDQLVQLYIKMLDML
jgi:glycosyltransferase involved in cell wall biosynthesis